MLLSGEHANCIHDGQKIVGGNRDMLRKWYGIARCSIVCRGGTGAWGPEKTEGSGVGSAGAGGGEAGTESAGA